MWAHSFSPHNSSSASPHLVREAKAQDGKQEVWKHLFLKNSMISGVRIESYPPFGKFFTTLGKEVTWRVATLFFRFLYVRTQGDVRIIGSFQFRLSQLEEEKELMFTEYLLSAWHDAKCLKGLSYRMTAGSTIHTAVFEKCTTERCAVRYLYVSNYYNCPINSRDHI